MKKNNESSLFKGILYYSISSWINIIIGFVSVIISTRIIRPEVYGDISIFLTATNFIMYIINFGIDGAYIRFFNSPPNNDSKNQLLYKNIIISSFVTIIVSFILIGPFSPMTSKYIFGFNSRKLMLIVVIYSYAQAIFRYLNITYRMGFRVREYTIQNVLLSSLTRVIIIFLGLVTDNSKMIITILGISFFGLMILYLIKQRREVIPYSISGLKKWSFSLKGYFDYIKFALYSAPSYFVTYFNSFASQGIIRDILGSYSLGLFSSCGMFKTIMSALQGGFATYWSAFVYKNYENEKQKIADMHEYILLVATAFASGLVIFRDVIYLLIGKQYHDSKAFFSLLLISAILNFIRETTDKGIAIAKRNEIMLIANSVAVAVNLATCWILIPLLGVKAAAIGDAVSAILLYLIVTICSQKFYRTIYRRSRSVIIIIMIILIMMLPTLIPNILFIILATFFIDVVIIWILKDRFVIVIQMIRSKLLRK